MFSKILCFLFLNFATFLRGNDVIILVKKINVCYWCVGEFLKQIDKDLKNVKIWNIQPLGEKIQRFEVWKSAILLLKKHKMAFFSNFEAPYLLFRRLYFQYLYGFEIHMWFSLQQIHHHISNTHLFFFHRNNYIIFPQKCSKTEQQKHRIFGNVKFYLVANF